MNKLVRKGGRWAGMGKHNTCCGVRAYGEYVKGVRKKRAYGGHEIWHRGEEYEHLMSLLKEEEY